MRYTRTQAVLWLLAYTLAVLLPLLAARAGDAPAARGFVIEFGVALGFIGLGMFWAQFALTARFRHIAGPFGLDAMLQFHRQAGIIAYGFVLAHPVLLVAAHPPFLEFLDPRASFTRAAALSAVILAATLLIVSTLWRLRLGLAYPWWRRLHAVLSAFIVFVGIVHVFRVAYYIADPLRQALITAGTLSALGLLAYTRAVKPWQLGRRPWRVARVEPLAPGVWRVALEPVGHAGMAFEAGQFAWVAFGASPLRAEQHPFSITSAAARSGTLEFAIKELGDFTSSVGRLRVGDPAFVEGPHGAFVLPADERPLVLIAGGIGISPLIGMLRTLAARADTRAVTLIYATADTVERPFGDELAALREALNLELIDVVERASGETTADVGRLDGVMLRRLLPSPSKDANYLICGPDPLMDAVERALLDAGVPPSRIDAERFNIA